MQIKEITRRSLGLLLVLLSMAAGRELAWAQDPSIVISPEKFEFVRGTANARVLTIFGVGEPLDYTVTVAATISGTGNWLTVNPTSGVTPGQINIFAAPPDGINTGTYYRILIAGKSRTTGKTVVKTVAVDVLFGQTGTPVLLTGTQNSATLLYEPGNTTMQPPQMPGIGLTVIGGNTAVHDYTASVISQDNFGWLRLGKTAGSTPDTLNSTVNLTGLGLGVYHSAIVLESSTVDNSPYLIIVQLTLRGAPEISLDPPELLFRIAQGSNPAPQSFQITNPGVGPLGWITLAATEGSLGWLTASPLSGVTPSKVDVFVNSVPLARGGYKGTVTVASLPSGTAPTKVVDVSLAVDVPSINLGGVVNGAGFERSAAFSPGSIVSLFGAGFIRTAATTGDTTGYLPASSAERRIEKLALPTTLEKTQVLVNNVQAPLYAVTPTQINLQMPSNLFGLTADIVVVADGVTGLTTRVQLAQESPGIFQVGTGQQGAVLLANTDVIAAPVGSIAGRTTRAVARGDYISIYATGLGRVSPPVSSGEVAPSSPLSEMETKPTVIIGGITLTPQDIPFAGLAPAYSGLYQVNARVPQNVAPGSAVTLQIKVGTKTSNSVTIAVQ